jgi:hypothetical protein
MIGHRIVMILPCAKRNDTKAAAGKGSARIVQEFTSNSHRPTFCAASRPVLAGSWKRR